MVVEGWEMGSGVSAGQGPLTPLQKRFINLGLEGLDNQETIELILSLALPCRKCKRLAKEYIEHFTNLRGFLSASPQELEQAGLPLHCICGIKLLHELPKEILKEKIMQKPVYKSSREVLGYLCYSMRDLKKEIFKAIYLNRRHQIIDTIDLFEGTLEDIPVSPREIVESAVKHHPAAIIFVHNHPSGDPSPSQSDKRFTRDLVFIGMILQIKVLDHIIIGEDASFSFADDGLIQKYEDSFLNLRIRGMFDIGVGYSPKSTRSFLPFLF